MSNEEPEIEIHAPVHNALGLALQKGLEDAGQTLTEADLRPFLLSVTDDSGALRAGCRGEIAFRSARVSQLWVHANLRGQGIGAALLRKAEAHARMEKCIRIHIETRSEGARRLYERLGYSVFGTLPDYDGTQAFYYLEKRLD